MNIKYTFANDVSGYGSAARNFVASLFIAGVNVTCEPIRQMAENTNLGLLGDLVENLKDRDIDYNVKIIHLTPDLIPDYKEKCYTISHLFWETSHLPKEWIAPLNSIDEIWTASEQMSKMIADSGVTTPCYAFPQPIITQTEKLKPFTTQYKKDFIFYSIFQWIDRKNPRGLLRAYWKEFEGNDNVTLLLKTYRINYAEGEYALIKQDINNWKAELNLKHYPKVWLVDKLLSDKQIQRLHLMGDCFVNPSSGEGWNRPMQEAMLYGKPVISGNNGGITDIIPQSVYYASPSFSQKATQVSYIPWYTHDMDWRVLDEKQLGSRMREVLEHYDKALKIGQSGQEYVMNNFSMQTVGEAMKRRLNEIESIK